MDLEGRLFLCHIVHKELEHLQVLVSMGALGINLACILRPLYLVFSLFCVPEREVDVGPFPYPQVSLPFIELTPLLSSLFYLFSLFTFFFSI